MFEHVPRLLSRQEGGNRESSRAHTRVAANPVGSGGVRAGTGSPWGCKRLVARIFWGWERAKSGKESQDFPTSQLNSNSPKSTGTINQTSYCKPGGDNKEMSNSQPGFVRSKVCGTI